MFCIFLDKIKNMEILNNMSKKIPVECWSRVVGYYRPITQWNKGKQAEFFDRKQADTKKTTEKATV